MKVLVLVPDLRHKGGVTNYYNCLKLDQQENIDYFFVSSTATSTEANPNMSVVTSILKKLLFLPLAYVRFLVTGLNYHVIHINPSLNAKSFYRDMGFILLSRILGKRILVFFRGWEEPFEEMIHKSRLLAWLFGQTYACADGYIVLGKIFRDKLVSLKVCPNKRFYVETTIADSLNIRRLDLDGKIKSFAEEVNLLFISRILKSKGIYIALDAVAICASKANRKITLFVAGDGEELENAKAYAVDKGYQNIQFTGYATNQMKAELLLKSHIMIFPTCYGEGLPNSVLEGMLYAMPIISRNVGGLPDVVENNINGFLDSSTDSDIFADYCLRLIEDKDLYERMARANYEKASTLFTTESVRTRLLGIYQDLSGK